MNHKGITFDTKLEELLQEVAAEPDSCLLRVEKKASHKALFQAPELMSANASRLTPAEKDIARYYREEVAWLLLELCLYLAVTDRAAGFAINPSVMRSDQPSPPSARSLRGRQEDLLTAASELTKPLSLVSRCIDAGDGLVLGEVAAVAGQLMPSTAARGYSRIHLINIGHLDEASRLAELIGKNPGTTRSWLSNCEGRGRIAYLRKNYSAAAFAYRESHRADPTRAIPTAFWVLNSLAAGDTAQAVEAVAAFESAVEHKEWSPVEFLACQGGQDRTKRSPSTRALGLHVAETAGTSGRQLINEILR